MTVPAQSDQDSSAQILRDIPSDTDEFAGESEPGPFARIADDIAEIVLKGSAGLVIGLEGPWGSGKSTVVNLVNQRLAKPHHLLVFDVWSHQGDVLRRSFLDQLISELGAAGLLRQDKDGYWAGRREELAGYKRGRREDVSAHLRPVGYLFLALTALVPLGLAIFSRALAMGDMSLIPISDAPIHSMGATGLVVSTAPLWFAFAYLLWANSCMIRRGKWKFDKVLEPLGNVFTASQNTATTRTIFETAQPTSVDFDIAFREVIDELKQTSPDTKLVVCFDNMDRVEANDVRSIVTTLRTFIDSGGRGSTQVWTLLPYSRLALEGLLVQKVNANDLYLDKLVQIAFPMPALPVVRWQSFLTRCIQRTSIGLTDVDIRRVLDLFELCNDQVTLTPRRLIRFSNMLAATLHRGRRLDPKFPLEVIVYLAHRLLLESAENIQQDLVRVPRITAPIAQIQINKQFEVWLASLLFYLPYSEAREWWLVSAVSDSLFTGNVFELKRLASLPEFKSALDRVDYLPIINGGKQESLLIAVNTIVNSKVEDAFVDRPSRRTSLQRLDEAINKVPVWYVQALEGFGWVAALALLSLGNPKTSLDVLRKIGMDTEGLSSPSKRWTGAMADLLDGLAVNDDQRRFLQQHYRVPLEGEKYLAACIEYGRLRRNGPGHCVFRSSNSALVGSNLSDLFQQGRNFDEDDRLAVSVATKAADFELAAHFLPKMREVLQQPAHSWIVYQSCFIALGHLSDQGVLRETDYPDHVAVGGVLMSMSSLESWLFDANELFWLLFCMDQAAGLLVANLRANAGQMDGWRRLMVGLSAVDATKSLRDLILECHKRGTFRPLLSLAIIGDVDDSLIEALKDPPAKLVTKDVLTKMGLVSALSVLRNRQMYEDLLARVIGQNSAE